MISVDYAPNEKLQDAKLALKLLFQPWRWRQGREVAKFKNLLKRKFFPQAAKNINIHLFFSGRSSLYYLLKTFRLEENTAVLIQAFTCEAVVLPILAHNFTPIYVDINKEDFCMDIKDLEKKYSSNAKVLILQHTFGITPKYRDEILQFAKEKKLIVIEDLAHGFDSYLFNKKRFTSHLLLSFGRSKTFSSVFGGGVVTQDPDTSQALQDLEKTVAFPSQIMIMKLLWYKILSVIIKKTYNSLYIGKLIHFVTNKLKLLENEISEKEKKGKYDYKFSKAFPNVCAILMMEQLKTFNDVTKQRMRTVSLYQSILDNDKRDYSQPLIRYPYLSPVRNKILSKAKKQDIYLGKWYDQVVAPASLDIKKVKYKNGSCPTAETVTEHVINLPTNVSKKQAEKVIMIVKSTEEIQMK